MTCQAIEDNYNWIGTNTGLIRLNIQTGEKTFYNHSNSGLPGNWISNIAIDSNGNKWIICSQSNYYDHSIVKFDNTNWTVYVPNHADASDYNIYCLTIDNNNKLWIGTSEYGLVSFDGSNWMEYNIANSDLPSNRVNCITIDNQNKKWIGFGGNTGSGIAYFDDNNWTIYDSTNSALGDWAVKTISIDANNTLWVGCYRNVYVLDNQNWTTHTLNGIVYSTIVDNNNNVWIASELGVFRATTSSWNSMSIPGAYWQSWAHALAIDTNHHIWVVANTYTDQVLFKHNGGTWIPYNDLSNSKLPGNFIQFMEYQNPNKMWFGEATINVNDFIWENYDINNLNFPNIYISQIKYDDFGNIWFISQQDDLAKYNGSTWTTFPGLLPGATFTCLDIDSEQNVWIGTQGNGLIKFDGTNCQIFNTTNSSLPFNRIISIAIDGQGNKWIGTYNAALVKIDSNNTFTVYDHTNSQLPQADAVWDIQIDSENNLWFSCWGLIKFDGVNWTLYNTSNSDIPTTQITAITIDSQNNKWLGSFMGLIKFDGVNWTTYDTENSGLADDDIECLEVDAFNNKWIGTDQQGVFVFNESGIVEIYENFLPAPHNSELSNYPNPFNPSTTICFDLQKPDKVNLSIYNIKGQKVKTLIDQNLNSGNHKITWNGKDDTGKNVSSGVYFCKLATWKGGQGGIRKVILMK